MRWGRAAPEPGTSVDESPASGPLDAPLGNYRVAGGLEVRAIELEQELLQTKEKVRALEREMYAARKVLRRRRGLSGVAYGGVGAAIGTVLAMIARAFVEVPEPTVWWGLILLGFVFGGLLGMRWETSDDDAFPPAPPPRGF